jgi:ribonuclease D
MSFQNKKLSFFQNDIPDDFELHGALAIDTEAMGLNNIRDRLCMIQICDESGNVALVHFPDSNYNYECKNLKKYLTDPKIEKIFHFARFDVAIIKHYLKISKIENIYCTKIASKFARTYTDKHSLKNLVNEILGIELKKEQRSTNWGQDDITMEQKRYAEQDVLYLHELKQILEKMLEVSKRTKIVKDFSNFIDTIASADLMGFSNDIFSHHSNPVVVGS